VHERLTRHRHAGIGLALGWLAICPRKRLLRGDQLSAVNVAAGSGAGTSYAELVGSLATGTCL